MPKYNAEEVLQIAIDIEVNGQKFYRQAASIVADTAARQKLRDLADMEVWHEKFFRELYDQVKTDADAAWRIDPANEESLYLQAIADGKIFPKQGAAWSIEQMPQDLQGILENALAREKDAVIFFLAMENAAVNQASRDSIHRIVIEEMSHVRMLAEDLAALGK